MTTLTLDQLIAAQDALLKYDAMRTEWFDAIRHLNATRGHMQQAIDHLQNPAWMDHIALPDDLENLQDALKAQGKGDTP